MKAIKKVVYESIDGLAFPDKEACEKHEARMGERQEKTSYWRVYHSPDLTEGRGWSKLTLVECYGDKHYAKELMMDWCFREFGRPVAYVMGVAVTSNWMLGPSKLTEFIDQEIYTQVGDYRYSAKRVCLRVEGDGVGLVLDKEAMAGRGLEPEEEK